MHDINKLRVFKQARINLKEIMLLLKDIRSFGDIRNQMQRSAISVVSNIAEGAGSDSNKQFIRFLNIARSSNNECNAQLLILADLGEIDDEEGIIKQVEIVGKMLTKFIQHLT